MKARKWICHVHFDGIIGMDNRGNHKRTFSEIPESDRFWVTETQPILTELQAVRNELKVKTGWGLLLSEKEKVKIALARLDKLIKTLGDGNG